MHTLNRATLPRYLRSDQDIAVWHALEAAIGQVRDDVMQGNVDPDDTQLLDERIRTEFIPHALAEQEHTLPPGTQLPPYAAQVVFSLLRGFAELDPLLLDPEVSEVIVDGPDQEVYVERHGLLEGTGLVLSRDRILYLAERMGSAHGQLLSEARPVQEIRLPNARVTAVHDRLILGGPSLVIRLHGRRRLRSAELVALGTISQPLLDALCLAFQGGANVLIAGEVSSGKTTLLQVLLESLPPDRRIVTVEDPAEIELPRPRLKQLEVRQPNNEGTGGYTQRDLVRLSLRLRPDHLIVGEVRDGAGWDMVDAMSLGHNGSVATIHAGSPRLATGLQFDGHPFRFVDTVFGQGGGVQLGFNEYAAFPSLHVAWALLVGLALVWLARSPLVWVLGGLYPLLMLTTVIVTGNHYIVDGLASLLVISVAVALAVFLEYRHANDASLGQSLRRLYQARHADDAMRRDIPAAAGTARRRAA